MNDLEFLCFDVLGDHVDPRDIEIAKDGKSVFAWMEPGIDSRIVRSDWNAAVKGTRYEGVRLILGVRP